MIQETELKKLLDVAMASHRGESVTGVIVIVTSPDSIYAKAFGEVPEPEEVCLALENVGTDQLAAKFMARA